MTGPFIVVLPALVGWRIATTGLWWSGNYVTVRDVAKDPGFTPLLRTLGYSSSPGALIVLGWLPGIGIVLAAIRLLWIVVTTVVALRFSFGIGLIRAILTGIHWLICHGDGTQHPVVNARTLVPPS